MSEATKKVRLLTDTTNPNFTISKEHGSMIGVGTELEFAGDIPAPVMRLIGLKVAEVMGLPAADANDQNDGGGKVPGEDDEIAALLQKNAKELDDAIGETITDPEMLAKLLAAETAGKKRTTVIKAIEAALAKN